METRSVDFNCQERSPVHSVEQEKSICVNGLLAYSGVFSFEIMAAEERTVEGSDDLTAGLGLIENGRTNLQAAEGGWRNQLHSLWFDQAKKRAAPLVDRVPAGGADGKHLHRFSGIHRIIPLHINTEIAQGERLLPVFY